MTKRTAIYAFSAVFCACSGPPGPPARRAPPGAGQKADSVFTFKVDAPAYPKGRGPVVAVDEAHANFHTAAGRYRPFARVLAADGYVVRPRKRKFTASSLSGISILVIANALHPLNVKNWTVPIHPAFSPSEIAAVKTWVHSGGRLLFIADHMPLPGAAANLGRAFGVTFNNGFAMRKRNAPRPRPMAFTRADKTLNDHPIVRGRNPRERVTRVMTFTGQAFRAGADARPVLTFGPGVISLMPKTAWRFTKQTPRVDVSGWHQGVTLTPGRGRVAVFGEAAMFTAQRTGAKRRPVGLNAPGAGQNLQFLLNVMHWLSGRIPENPKKEPLP